MSDIDVPTDQATIEEVVDISIPSNPMVRDVSSKYTLCLTMIVKNESKIITRLLNSVASIVDYICITDTGSTDNTVELIEDWGKEHKIPTTVCTSEFRDFGYSRNRSLKNSKKTYPKADFLLLLDGDFVVELNGFTKAELNLKCHKYTVKQYDKWKAWGNIRIIANWVDWEYRLRTHEYLCASPQQTRYSGEVQGVNLTTLRINDIGDGGSKLDKFERDQRLLLEDVADPTLTANDLIRCYYYLGNSYKNGNKHMEAIPWYQKRVDAGGWYEEVYLSWCHMGECYQNQYDVIREAVKIVTKRQTATPNTQLIIDELAEYLTEEITGTLAQEIGVDAMEEQFLKKHQLENVPLAELVPLGDQYFKQAIQCYMKGYAFCKIRAEALYAIVKMLRVRGNTEQSDQRRGLSLALEGLKIPIPAQCTLEVQTGIHTYGFDSEIMILAYYVPGQLHHGQAAKDRLSGKLEQMSGAYSWMYEQNKRFYN